MAAHANSKPCQFCGATFPGYGKTRAEAEADAHNMVMNHEFSCLSNPANGG